MKELTEIRQGWTWPKTDTNCWRYMNRYPDVPGQVSQKVQKHHTVVQAGGNCGFYVKQYAELFQRVYTFEPDPVNFYCLTVNVTDHNVIKSQSCLGHDHGLLDLNRNQKNVGKNHVCRDNARYPTVMIDDLALDRCDLIHLDIEGYEYYALLGARKTIEQHAPVIVVEVWDQLNDRYEPDINSKMEKWLTDRGYVFTEVIGEADRVYKFST